VVGHGELDQAGQEAELPMHSGCSDQTRGLGLE
jgi:hypothetical protein